MIQIFVTQKFAGRPRKGDRRGFGFVADVLKSAKAELGRWRATDIAIDPDNAPSFSYYCAPSRVRAREETRESRAIPCLFLNTRRGEAEIFGGKTGFCVSRASKILAKTLLPRRCGGRKPLK